MYDDTCPSFFFLLFFFFVLEILRVIRLFIVDDGLRSGLRMFKRMVIWSPLANVGRYTDPTLQGAWSCSSQDSEFHGSRPKTSISAHQWRSQTFVMVGVLAPSPPFPLYPPPALLFLSAPFVAFRSRTQLNPARGSERCELSQRVMGWSPSRNRNLVHFSRKIRHLVATILIMNHCFCSITKQ